MDDLKDHNLDINPSNEIRFKGPFTHVVTRHLKLTNLGKKSLCYKVKTTAPKMYCVRPNSGLIECGKCVDVSIMLQPFEYSSSDKVRHKFLIQSVVADESNLENAEQLWKSIDKDMIREIKLKCSFDQEPNAGDLIAEDEIVPSRNVSNNTQLGLSMTVDELKIQLSELKKENERLKTAEGRLRKIALQDTLDNSSLPNLVSDTKNNETNNFLLIIVLCLIAFFVGIAVAKFSL